ncbi:MAG TPA: hypothetical protein VGQ99_24005 [Tepidisphaeraceae bacterium]|nr:hypothetical protein [Tepidisphaeraceae bacterium]
MSRNRGRKFKRYSDRPDLIKRRRRQFMPVLEKVKLAQTFMHLPQWLRHKVLNLKAAAYRVEAHPSLAESAQGREVLTEINEAFAKPIFKPSGVSYNEFHCFLAPLLRCVHTALKDRRLKPSQVVKMAPMLKKGVKYYRKIGDKRVGTELFKVIFRRSRLDERLFGLRFVKDVSGRKPVTIVYVHAERPRRCIFNVDGEKRPAFQAGEWFGDEGFIWVEWPGSLVGRPPHEKLPVYVQSHVLHRLFDRLVLPQDRWMVHFDMVMSLRHAKIIQQENDSFWIEYTDHLNHRLGYLIANVIDEKVLIRTFLFLTMQGTPEARLLHERLGARRSDIERLRLDELATFLDTDLADDAELTQIFTDCGCGHLFDLSKRWSRDAYKKWTHAQRIREYLHLPGTPKNS